MSDSQENVVPLGESEAFIEFQQKLSKAAKVNRSILVIGERGTGKELAARRLHYLSSRWDKPLVTVNCAALPPSLIETELFGHESGAFTGATKNRKGRFEEAEEGTLFLDEIGLIPLEVQEKILRVVEYGTYEKVGSSVSHKSNVRIIGATNADLVELCDEGKFKRDLLDRLSFEVLFLPPLRKRAKDIILLANYFASKMSVECKKDDLPVLSEEVENQLLEYKWPGNVRELKNVIERAVYRSDTNEITNIDLNPFDNPFKDDLVEEKAEIKNETLNQEEEKEQKNDSVETGVAQSLTLDDLNNYEINRRNFDLEYLREAMNHSDGNQREAAKLLNLSYDQLRGLYRKFKSFL